MRSGAMILLFRQVLVRSDFGPYEGRRVPDAPDCGRLGAHTAHLSTGQRTPYPTCSGLPLCHGE